MSKIMEKVMDIWCIFRLILADVIRLLEKCFFATILVSICIENGWILCGNLTEVSYEIFWNMFRTFSFYVIPIILLYHGITGRYRIAKVKLTVPIIKE